MASSWSKPIVWATQKQTEGKEVGQEEEKSNYEESRRSSSMVYACCVPQRLLYLPGPQLAVPFVEGGETLGDRILLEAECHWRLLWEF